MFNRHVICDFWEIRRCTKARDEFFGGVRFWLWAKKLEFIRIGVFEHFSIGSCEPLILQSFNNLGLSRHVQAFRVESRFLKTNSVNSQTSPHFGSKAYRYIDDVSLLVIIASCRLSNEIITLDVADLFFKRVSRREKIPIYAVCSATNVIDCLISYPHIKLLTCWSVKVE